MRSNSGITGKNGVLDIKLKSARISPVAVKRYEGFEIVCKSKKYVFYSEIAEEAQHWLSVLQWNSCK